MDNSQFLDCIKDSFITFLETGSRSNAKLKILHGRIAEDLAVRLGSNYEIKSLGFADNKEGKIQGRYINKNVDITIYKDSKPIAGIGVKFVMQNYAQNSNNYFENMLGETANIRSNNIPYFQIFIIPEKLPYYENNGNIKKWETFDQNNIHKYMILSTDNIDTSIHTPIKTLIYVLNFTEIDIEIREEITTRQDYINHYQNLSTLNIITSNTNFGKIGNNVILNNYDYFMEKVKHRILSI